MKPGTKFKVRAGIAIFLLLAFSCGCFYVAEVLFYAGRMS